MALPQFTEAINFNAYFKEPEIMFENFLFALTEWGTNRYIQLDSYYLEFLKPLQGKEIEFNLSVPKLHFVIRIETDRLSFLSSSSREADVIITAHALALFRQALKRVRNKTELDQDIEISGDLRVLQRFTELLENIRPDWEEQLSRLFGDVLSRPIIVIINSVLNKMQKTQTTFLDNVTEYIHEEKRLSPGIYELEDFAYDLRELRDAVERLECRIDRIQQKTNLNENTNEY